MIVRMGWENPDSAGWHDEDQGAKPVTNQLLEAAPGIGHNAPPLSEVIAEDLRPLVARATSLVSTAAAAVIVDDDSARKVIDLDGLIDALMKDLDGKRKAVKEPYLAACREIDGAYNGTIRTLEIARRGEDGRGGLRRMLDEFSRKKQAEAAEARRIAEEEQRRREAEAEAARAKAQDGTLTDELAAMRAREEAEAARKRAEAIRPEPVRAQLGSLGTQRSISWDIEDLPALLRWMLKQPMRTVLEAAVRELMGKYLRQLGVDAVERGVSIPGLKAWVERTAAIRR